MKEKELRKEFIKGVIEEVRGPRFGIDEIINYNPSMEYLVSTLIPVDWKNPKKNNNRLTDLDAENVNELDYKQSEDNSGGSDNILGDNSPILNPNSQIKSFGISFIVNSIYSEEMDVCVTWARYLEDYDENKAYNLNGLMSERGARDIFWKRNSFYRLLSIQFDRDNETGYDVDSDEVMNISINLSTSNEQNTEIFSIYEDDDGKIDVVIKFKCLSKDKYHVSLYLVNNLKVTPTNKYRPETHDCIFQPSIRVNFKDSDNLSSMDTVMQSNNELDYLYENKPVLATGHLCSVIWHSIEYYDEFEDFNGLIWPDESIVGNFNEFTRPTIRSEFLPLYLINLPNFDVDVNMELYANKLAYLSQEDLYNNCILLYFAYKDWIENNKVDSNKITKDLILKQKQSLKRIKQGIDLIKSNELVYLAFCFANKTIHLQDEWKRGINTDNNITLSRYCDDEAFEWRPFQLAFILINLESIWNDNSPNKDTLDLLWIPTGGGKTEAYLGLMAFTIALRRLKSTYGLSDEKTGAGVSVLSRYTLRLLTVQQYRRTLRMVTAAEFLRVYSTFNKIGWTNSAKFSKNWLYGSVRFSVGMWVGGAVTPLHLYKDKEGAIDLLKSNEHIFGVGNPAQILKCPVCGAWLTVPDEGLTDLKNHIHIVIESPDDVELIKQKLDNINVLSYVKCYDVIDKNHKSNHFTISIYFNRSIDADEYESLIDFIKGLYDISSLNPYSPGYIRSQGKIKGRQREDTDYEIWCTNPNCALNHNWMEGVPSNDKKDFPDGNKIRNIESPFLENSKIPIPAYLVDDHIYHRCPTIIVSTADKIARLAFEERCGSIFGNVDRYNHYYGYHRNYYLPLNHSKYVEEDYVSINSLNSLDLIIQDELHLMNGPLGSLFGLYENMVAAIINKQRGHPKYIASTATINNAESQVKALFSKKVSQFPPYGVDISNSFFVKDSNISWDENNNGRVYMGIYAPGLGHFTHQIRLYSRLLKIAQDNINEEKIKYYWTLVGYYNAIRELGGGVALYKDDIKSRLKYISQEDNLRLIKGESDKKELSSRIDSTELPLILDGLERDGDNPNHPSYNAIFTTSMFGTGVDISHLSTMVMNAQPKTTGDYIQATGRIGRNHGGLIIDLFRSGRPRDLNHYEMFSSYHSRINREVEPVSVSPFSQGCLSRGLGSSLVAFLRNANNLVLGDKWNETPKNILLSGAHNDIEYFKEFTKNRLIKMGVSDSELKNFLNEISVCENKWKNIAHELDENEFIYSENKNPYKNEPPKKNVVLGTPAHEKVNELNVVFKNAPMSLRDIEDTLGFRV